MRGAGGEMRHGAIALAVLFAASVRAQDTAPAEPAPTEPASTETAPAPETVPTVPVAQEPAAEPAPAKDEPTALDAIEVTAQRRTQRLVDVPLAVTAITQDQIEARGI